MRRFEIYEMTCVNGVSKLELRLPSGQDDIPVAFHSAHPTTAGAWGMQASHRPDNWGGTVTPTRQQAVVLVPNTPPGVIGSGRAAFTAIVESQIESEDESEGTQPDLPETHKRVGSLWMRRAERAAMHEADGRRLVKAQKYLRARRALAEENLRKQAIEEDILDQESPPPTNTIVSGSKRFYGGDG